MELHGSVDECIECVILTDSYVVAWVVLGATLTNDDVASHALLTAENLDTQSLGCTLAAVLRTTYTFFMSDF